MRFCGNEDCRGPLSVNALYCPRCGTAGPTANPSPAVSGRGAVFVVVGIVVLLGLMFVALNRARSTPGPRLTPWLVTQSPGPVVALGPGLSRDWQVVRQSWVASRSSSSLAGVLTLVLGPVDGVKLHLGARRRALVLRSAAGGDGDLACGMTEPGPNEEVTVTCPVPIVFGTAVVMDYRYAD